MLGNGTWVNVGGNQPVGPGGLNALAGAPPYINGDGGRALRSVMSTPCVRERLTSVAELSMFARTRRAIGLRILRSS